MAANRLLKAVPPREERASAFATAVARSEDAPYHVPAQSGYLALPVASMSHDLLVYRIDNGRILSELSAHAERIGTTLEAVKARGEELDIQEVLHGLLLEKARNPEGPIHEELRVHARQTEPLLIQPDGTVLNGNRRLAAMRDLMASDPDRFGHFAQVRAAVLPADLDRTQFEYIEAALQMAPDLKLDYSWINRRLKLRQHLQDMGREVVAAAYRFKEPAEIDNELAELELAEDYLQWVGRPRQFGDLIDHGEVFALLRQQLQQVLNLKLQAVWRHIGFAMIAEEGNLDRAIVHLFPFAAPVPPAARNWVAYTLAEQHGLADPQQPGENRPVTPAIAGRLAAVVSDPTKAEALARSSVALQDRLRADQVRLLGASQVLHHLITARRSLEGRELGEFSDQQLRQIRAEIAALEQIALDRSGHPSRDAGIADRLKEFKSWLRRRVAP